MMALAPERYTLYPRRGPESMILPALKRGGYSHDVQVNIGTRILFCNRQLLPAMLAFEVNHVSSDFSFKRATVFI